MGTVGIIITTLSAIVAVLGGVWTIVDRAMKVGKNNSRLDRIEKTVDKSVESVNNIIKSQDTHNARLDRIEKTVDKISVDIDGLKQNINVLKVNEAERREDHKRLDKLAVDMGDMKEDMAAVKTVLVQKFPNVVNIMAMKKSPRKLNETGKWVFEQIKGEEFLSEHKNFFFKKIDSMNPKTAFDVEQAANFACAGYTDNEMFNDIKLYVYNAPAIKIKDSDGKERDYEISLGDVCYTLSLPLRDMYLEAHPEIPR